MSALTVVTRLFDARPKAPRPHEATPGRVEWAAEGYLDALADLRRELLADVSPKDHAGIAGDIFREATANGVPGQLTAAEFLAIMFRGDEDLDRTIREARWALDAVATQLHREREDAKQQAQIRETLAGCPDIERVARRLWGDAWRWSETGHGIEVMGPHEGGMYLRPARSRFEPEVDGTLILSGAWFGHGTDARHIMLATFPADLPSQYAVALARQIRNKRLNAYRCLMHWRGLFRGENP